MLLALEPSIDPAATSTVAYNDTDAMLAAPTAPDSIGACVGPCSPPGPSPVVPPDGNQSGFHTQQSMGCPAASVSDTDHAVDAPIAMLRHANEAWQAVAGLASAASPRQVHPDIGPDDVHCHVTSTGSDHGGLLSAGCMAGCDESSCPGEGQDRKAGSIAPCDRPISVTGPDTGDENEQPPVSGDSGGPPPLLSESAPPSAVQLDSAAQPPKQIPEMAGQEPSARDHSGTSMPALSSVGQSTSGSIAEDIECGSDRSGHGDDGTSWSSGIAPDGMCHNHTLHPWGRDVSRPCTSSPSVMNLH